jgi:hypothetical protein
MKTIIKALPLLGIIPLIVLLSSTKHAEIERVEAKNIIEHVEKHIGKMVETEGKIVHVCGVDKKKMRIFVEDVGYIQIIPENSSVAFDYDFNQKEIKVVGVVKEIRVYKKQIDEMEQAIAIPCSIDKLPCADTAYVERRKGSGDLQEESSRKVNALKETMGKTNKDYISVPTIVTKSVELK